MMRTRQFRRRWLATAAVCGLMVVSVAVAQLPDEVRNYQVNYTSAPPTIDGSVGAGEWDAAQAESGDWRMLREPGTNVDQHNSRFRALWDEEALYLLWQSDYSGWFSQLDPQGISFGDDNLNIYIDPNRDGEENFPDGFGQGTPFTAVDGYQVAFNNHLGSFACGADGVALTADDCSIDNRGDPTQSITTGSTFGAFAEAHVDAQFGNQGEWAGMRLTTISQVNGASGGLAEMRIPWADLDALDEVNGVPTGLQATTAPENGETWFFNIAAITTDSSNFLPSWNWTSSQFFTDRPHGDITFQGRPGSSPDGDFDGDGLWNCDDINALVVEIVAGTNNPAFDMNGDGVVDGADIYDTGTGWLAVGGANSAQTGGNPFLPGDADLSGAVDVSDFNLWNGNKFTSISAWCSGDFNADGSVDVSDFNIWNGNKFQTSSSPSVVPEPAATWSLLWVLGWLAYRRR